MATIDQINSRITEVKAETNFMIKSDIKALPEVLTPDETFLNLIPGLFRDRNGILVLTNKRLIFVHKKLIVGITVESFYLNKVTLIQYNTGLMMADIIISTAGSQEKIKQVAKRTVKDFCAMSMDEITKSHQSPMSTSPISNVEQLEKLAKLKESGLLNDEEFQIEKKKILS
jgi:hypothetical protein